MSDFKAKMHQSRLRLENPALSTFHVRHFQRPQEVKGREGGEGENDLTHPCRKFLDTPLPPPPSIY